MIPGGARTDPLAELVYTCYARPDGAYHEHPIETPAGPVEAGVRPDGRREALFMAGTITQEGPPVRVRARMPLVRHWRHIYKRRSTGEIMEVDIVWLPWRDWTRDNRSSSPAWHTHRIGPFILAFLVTL